PAATSPLALHDALPISGPANLLAARAVGQGRWLWSRRRWSDCLQLPRGGRRCRRERRRRLVGGLAIGLHVTKENCTGKDDCHQGDRKSTRLNSSHVKIS